MLVLDNVDACLWYALSRLGWFAVSGKYNGTKVSIFLLHLATL